jgi:uncharacterized protein YutE (UPF0331/DUF86 family)
MITNQAEDDLPKTYDELFTQLEEKGILFEEFWAALVTAQKLASKVNDEGGGNHV